MIPVGGDSWTISISTDPAIEFAIWVLMRDGLKAGAFDAHPEGDRRLRSTGLTADLWLAWLAKLLNLREDAPGTRDSQNEALDPSEVFFSHEPPTLDDIDRYQEHLRAQTAAGRFAGPAAVRAVLLELWPEYSREERDGSEREFNRLNARLEALTEQEGQARIVRARRFWDDLQAHRPLPPLHFYLVGYVRPTVSVFPPASAVLGLVDPHEEDLEGYRSLIFEAAALLKSSPGMSSS